MGALAARRFNAPILLAQHMPAAFTTMLAEHISRIDGITAHEAKDGEPIRNGSVYVAPGDFHLTVASRGGSPVAVLDKRPPVNFCRPAVDPLFESGAQVYGPAAVALVLTGMGQDGADGAKFIAEAGGRVFVQDEATSVVWGMPGAVTHAGLAQKVLPLDEIGPFIADTFGSKR